jgi:hypothetical protein
MAWRRYNPNGHGRKTTDCSVRAVAKALNLSWREAFKLIASRAYEIEDMLDANHVWGSVLEMHGFRRYVIPYVCPDCYTIRDFCLDHPLGMYVVGTGSHVVTVIDGDWYDAWDSGNEIPIYYYWRSDYGL